MDVLENDARGYVHVNNVVIRLCIVWRRILSTNANHTDVRTHTAFFITRALKLQYDFSKCVLQFARDKKTSVILTI